MGHTVTVARNGAEALEILERDRFDLVVMDIQMPRMDGLEATRAFRSREKELGGHLPIVAMTAYAMKGDKEACLQAGMDAYVSKPITAQELHEAIEHALGGLKRDFQQASMPAARAPALDRAAILDRVGGDTHLLKEIVGMFVDDCPTLLGEIREAFQHRDSARLEHAAHTLKGSVSNFAAPAAMQAAQKLEAIGRSRELMEAPQAIMQLEREIDWVRTELIALDREAEP
jgi:two-component system sensor histidine kinase/response regulator